MVDYLTGMAMLYGHPPERAREFAYRDLELMALVADEQTPSVSE
jgi:hypothetical protein